MTDTQNHPFIEYLETLKENRAALADLRRSLGQPEYRYATAGRYVIPRLPADKPYLENWYYLVAGLYALHPENTTHGNLGTHFARTLDHSDQERNKPIERRFTTLLSAHPDDLPDHLRQAISYLKSSDTPIAINWSQLLRDLSNWSHPDRFVQKNWANAFWGQPVKQE